MIDVVQAVLSDDGCKSVLMIGRPPRLGVTVQPGHLSVARGEIEDGWAVIHRGFVSAAFWVKINLEKHEYAA